MGGLSYFYHYERDTCAPLFAAAYGSIVVSERSVKDVGTQSVSALTNTELDFETAVSEESMPASPAALLSEHPNGANTYHQGPDKTRATDTHALAAPPHDTPIDTRDEVTGDQGEVQLPRSPEQANAAKWAAFSPLGQWACN